MVAERKGVSVVCSLPFPALEVVLSQLYFNFELRSYPRVFGRAVYSFHCTCPDFERLKSLAVAMWHVTHSLVAPVFHACRCTTLCLLVFLAGLLVYFLCLDSNTKKQ